MTLYANIKRLRHDNGWTQSDLAKFSGVSVETIKRYEKGKTNPTNDNLEKIANALNVRIKDLYDDVSLLTNHEDITSRSQSVGFAPNKSSTVTYYPNIRASAGYGNINDNEESIDVDTNLLNAIKLSKSKLDMIQVQGDSMHPYINNGDFALIERSNEAKNGDIVIANYQGDLYVKELQKNPQNRSISLISSNKDYPSFEVKEDELESLRIVGVLRAIVRVY
ncbi:MAG: XRE family transcriptional regulator [Wolinella sp.]